MVVIQNIINDATVDEEKLKLTCEQFMQELDVGDSELVVRLVSRIEIQVLNKDYRSKNQVTNVLSFSSDIPLEIGETICSKLLLSTLLQLKEKFDVPPLTLIPIDISSPKQIVSLVK